MVIVGVGDGVGVKACELGAVLLDEPSACKGTLARDGVAKGYNFTVQSSLKQIQGPLKMLAVYSGGRKFSRQVNVILRPGKQAHHPVVSPCLAKHGASQALFWCWEDGRKCQCLTVKTTTTEHLNTSIRLHH